MVGSHLDDCDVVFLGQLQERLGHSDVVVEVALCIEHIVFLFQHGGNEFLRGGFAIRACDADDGGADMYTMIFGQLLQGGQHIVH